MTIKLALAAAALTLLAPSAHAEGKERTVFVPCDQGVTRCVHHAPTMGGHKSYIVYRNGTLRLINNRWAKRLLDDYNWFVGVTK